MERHCVWVPDKRVAWIQAEVVSSMGSSVVVDIVQDAEEVMKGNFERPEELERRTVLVNAVTKLIRTPGSPDEANFLPLVNGTMGHSGIEDMRDLTYLHEPALLDNLRRRFFAELPYTYAGDVLISVNPYNWLDIYDESYQKKYMDGSEELPPHPYAISARAYMNAIDKCKNQTILVSGDSGAGKTEMVKMLMEHLAFLSSCSGTAPADVMHSNDTVIRVLESNPLLETFGNALTTQNDNSSRFSKFVQMQFDASGRLLGSVTSVYLLEKSRVVHLDGGNKNFHIFYQILSLPVEQRKRYYLELRLEDYQYVVPPKGAMAKDPELAVEPTCFEDTVNELEVVGISEEERRQIFELIAGILNTGNLEIITSRENSEGSDIASRDQLAIVATLFGVAPAELASVLCTRSITARDEEYSVLLRREQAIDCRDGLAKAVYERLFLWLVDRINRSTGGYSAFLEIGLLDIFGFECFAHNSFEQLNINYTNEKLQQIFIANVVESVQEEYLAEGFHWAPLSPPDNRDVLELLDGKLGIFSMLNEECVLPQGSDQSFLSKLVSRHGSHPRLVRPPPKQAGSVFIIKHYAGEIKYTVGGFLEKNKDTLNSTVVSLLSKSKSPVLRSLFRQFDFTLTKRASPRGAGTPGSRASPNNRKRNLSMITTPTVAQQFQVQLSELVQGITSSDMSYVRCLKPNKLKSSSIFDGLTVVQQLRLSGIIEAIYISRSKFSSRMTFEDFYNRFRILGHGNGDRTSATGLIGAIKRIDLTASDEARSTYMQSTGTAFEAENAILLAQAVLPGGVTSEDQERIQSDSEVFYVIGKTKIFFRTHVLEELEHRRHELVDRNSRRIQAFVRRVSARKQFLQLREMVRVTQVMFKLRMKRKQRRALSHSAALIQATYRAYWHRRRYLKLRRAVLCLQARYLLLLRRWSEHHSQTSAILIQSIVRMFLAQRAAARLRQQRAFNVARTRLLTVKKNRSSRVIQRSFRRYSSRRAMLPALSALVFRRRQFSATKIQYWWRRYRQDGSRETRTPTNVYQSPNAVDVSGSPDRSSTNSFHSALSASPARTLGSPNVMPKASKKEPTPWPTSVEPEEESPGVTLPSDWKALNNGYMRPGVIRSKTPTSFGRGRGRNVKEMVKNAKVFAVKDDPMDEYYAKDEVETQASKRDLIQRHEKKLSQQMTGPAYQIHRMLARTLKATLTVQAFWRGYLVRRVYKARRAAIIRIQSFVRMYQAVRLVDRLRLFMGQPAKYKNFARIRLPSNGKIKEARDRTESGPRTSGGKRDGPRTSGPRVRTAQASAYSFPDEARTATRTTSGKLSLSPTASAALLSTFARSTRGTAATSSTSALSPSSQQNSSPSYPDVNNVTPPYPEPQPGYTERETEFVLTADGPVNMKYQNQLQNEIQDQMTERETEFDLTAFGPVKVEKSPRTAASPRTQAKTDNMIREVDIDSHVSNFVVLGGSSKGVYEDMKMDPLLARAALDTAAYAAAKGGEGSSGGKKSKGWPHTPSEHRGTKHMRSFGSTESAGSSSGSPRVTGYGRSETARTDLLRIHFEQGADTASTVLRVSDKMDTVTVRDMVARKKGLSDEEASYFSIVLLITDEKGTIIAVRTLQDDERPLEVAEEYTESVDIDGDSEKRKSSRKSGKPARMRVKFIYKDARSAPIAVANMKINKLAKSDEPDYFSLTQKLGKGDKCGYLSKVSQKERNVMRRRWFVLKDDKLWYCKNHENTRDLKFINLVATEIRERSTSGMAYSFEIITSERAFKLVASSRSEMHQWMEAIRKAKIFADENDSMIRADKSIRKQVRKFFRP